MKKGGKFLVRGNAFEKIGHEIFSDNNNKISEIRAMY